MEMITHTIQYGPHVRLELHWPAELATTLPDVEIDLHHRNGPVAAMDVIAALGGPSAFDRVVANYLTIKGNGNDDCDHEFTFWPTNETASSLPTNDTAKAVLAEQELAADDQ